ncbi:unnamed protein product [Musa acuminata subsp. malaccensis]|uniref:(wild Malaysian banana) hypothetical protein n=1 Tax=Musa acuminata subsp. malaccensis TaxID=214687 RepID=A0A8D6ZMV2_MUSAM|nr:unnamed protein product [Musa acuminata subsp. malaccensis]
MTSLGLGSVLHFGNSIGASYFGRSSSMLLCHRRKRFSSSPLITMAQQANEQLLVVVGGGASGVYASLRAKFIAPHLNVLVIEKGKPLAKVKISGGGRCNVTNGLFFDSAGLADNYPRGNRELRGSFFNIHGPKDTIRWFSDRGVELKTEEDGRVFPVSNSSASIVDCLLSEAKSRGVVLQIGKTVSDVSLIDGEQFLLKVEKRTMNFVEYIKADYVLMATGSSQQGYKIAAQLGHSIIDPVPSLFTFKIEDTQLPSLSGVTFPRVKAKLKLKSIQKNLPEYTQACTSVGPMLVTHWGLSGPVILRLSAWGARELFLSNYTGILLVDFVPDIHLEDVKYILCQHKDQLAKTKACNSFPTKFNLVKRFWRYLLEREGLDADILWASISNNHLNSIALLLKQCPFGIAGKGQFKDEFVTAGGVPLSEVSINTMESKMRPNLFFAGEILNVDGITGGFNFQNAWSGGYIAGTRIGELASRQPVKGNSVKET